VGQLRYIDFDLKIERDENHYTAQVLNSPFGEASSTFNLPFSEDKLENLILKIGHMRTGRGNLSTEIEAAREFGGKLFEAVFSNEVRDCFRSSLSQVNNLEETGLRLKLRLQNASELADLPWEYLFDSTQGHFFAQSKYTPIVRYLEMPLRISPLKVNLPLKILVMISSPAGYVPLDVEQEKILLQKALEPLIKDGLVQVEMLEKATLSTLQRYLREQEYHIFHFIGHGNFDQKTKEGVLVLEDELGSGWLATADRIGTILHDHRSLRLAILNSCEGARNALSDPFAGVATSLICQGVPCVIAMQFRITDGAAIKFSEEFYFALAAGFPVDAAVAEARKAIYALPNDVEWGTPVLYMRTDDGVLFDLVQEPVVENQPQDENPPKTFKKTPVIPHPKTAPKESNIGKSTGPILHMLEIKPEGTEIIRYDEKEVSRKNSLLGSTHIFQVSEEGENVEYKVEIGSRALVGVWCEVARNGDILFTDRTSNLKIVVYKGHRIEIKPEGTEIIRYDGKEVSRKNSFLGATHVFQVSEEGENVEYKVEIGSRGIVGVWCEVTRNGDILFTDRMPNLRKLWV
jgi:hypothetical protein